MVHFSAFDSLVKVQLGNGATGQKRFIPKASSVLTVLAFLGIWLWVPLLWWDSRLAYVVATIGSLITTAIALVRGIQGERSLAAHDEEIIRLNGHIRSASDTWIALGAVKDSWPPYMANSFDKMTASLLEARKILGINDLSETHSIEG